MDRSMREITDKFYDRQRKIHSAAARFTGEAMLSPMA